MSIQKQINNSINLLLNNFNRLEKNNFSETEIYKDKDNDNDNDNDINNNIDEDKEKENLNFSNINESEEIEIEKNGEFQIIDKNLNISIDSFQQISLNDNLVNFNSSISYSNSRYSEINELPLITFKDNDYFLNKEKLNFDKIENYFDKNYLEEIEKNNIINKDLKDYLNNNNNINNNYNENQSNTIKHKIRIEENKKIDNINTAKNFIKKFEE
jgi:hypothetical protein